MNKLLVLILIPFLVACAPNEEVEVSYQEEYEQSVRIAALFTYGLFTSGQYDMSQFDYDEYKAVCIALVDQPRRIDEKFYDYIDAGGINKDLVYYCSKMLYFERNNLVTVVIR